MQRSYSRLLGVVGKPNTGKSTFFSAATLALAEIANYPFTTIKPNKGIGYVRNQCVHIEFEVKDNPNNSLCVDGFRLIPIELIDVAGLVPGACEGRGLGNQFLDEIFRADALIHVVDASGGTDSEGRLCRPGESDPVQDVKFLEREITLWLASILKKDWTKLARSSGTESRSFYVSLEERLSGLGIRRDHLHEAIKKTGLNAEKATTWNNEEFLEFVDSVRQVSKPMLIVANKIDLPNAEENLARLQKLNYAVVPCCAEAELALRRAAEHQLLKYKPGDNTFQILQPEKLVQSQVNALETIRDRILLKHGSTGVQQALNKAYFDLLNMITVYPVEDIDHLCDHSGRVLPDVYLVPFGTTARQFAYVIHSDLGAGFLYAVNARDKKRIGEDAILRNQDVISIVSTRRRS